MVKSVGTKERVAGQFAVKYKSETHYWTKKLTGRLRGRQVLGKIAGLDVHMCTLENPVILPLSLSLSLSIA